jgi:prolyl oligopeptidase
MTFWTISLRPSILSAIFCSAVLALPVVAQNGPPVAPVRNVTDEYFGQKMVDPYRWLEDSKADETQKWFKGQANYAKNYLERLPMRDDIFKELTSLSDTGVRVSGIRPRGDLFFYTKRNPGEQDNKLYVREGMTGAERLLVDPTKITDGGKRFSLGDWSISWDGQYVSYVISAGGSENGEMRVIETATGKDTGERIDRARFGAGSWLGDGKTFLYSRLQKLAADAPQTDLYQKARVYRHTLGTNPDTDKAVFGFDVNPNVTFDQKMLPFVATDPNWKYAFAFVNSGVSPNYEIYVAPLEAVNQNTVPWRKIVSLEDEVSSFDLRGDDLYLTTYRNTPRYKIVRTSLKQPVLSKAETIFSGGEAVVEGEAAQRDAMYVQTLDGGIRKLYRVDYKTRRAEPLKLPYEGSVYINPTDTNADGIYFGIESWTKSTAHFRYDPKTGMAKNTNLVPPIQIDMSSVEFANTTARSYDGTMIPLVIIYKKGLKRDGTNPVLMNGYGAYGYENTSAFFFPDTLPWLNRGGVYVLAGIRGGGEYGEEWHLAGKGATKPNTWKDFIACAEYLIAEKYTSPKHLGMQGGSAGGILISNTIATRPELFGAAIDNVGLNDALRAETTSNGVPNIPEFGSFKTEDGFKNLLAMDGYLKVKDGLKYPAVLLTTGINDPRVEPWMSAKMTARLQAATSSGKPVLLRVDYDAGHGIGSTKEQRNKEVADEYAFLFQQLK